MHNRARQTLKQILIKILSLAQVFPTVLTDKDELISLIQKLYPISADKELIRLGPKGDGGYLLPDDLEGIGACFSPGVSTISGFEKDCVDLGMRVFLADNSVDNPIIQHDKFCFTKKHIGMRFVYNFMTIDEWVNKSLPDSLSDLLLQIDIEGYEYETFIGISDSLMRRSRIIIVEFHGLDQLWSRPFYKLASCAFEKILQSHACVHIHPNNAAGVTKIQGLDIPGICEFTFLRKDRIHYQKPAKVFPHPLDSNNTSNLSLSLPKCWYDV